MPPKCPLCNRCAILDRRKGGQAVCQECYENKYQPAVTRLNAPLTDVGMEPSGDGFCDDISEQNHIEDSIALGRDLVIAILRKLDREINFTGNVREVPSIQFRLVLHELEIIYADVMKDPSLALYQYKIASSFNRVTKLREEAISISRESILTVDAKVIQGILGQQFISASNNYIHTEHSIFNKINEHEL